MKKSVLLIFLAFFCNRIFAQLTIYSNYNLQGTSANCVVRTIYTGSTIPNGLDNQIKSISLSQGFMVTIAENEDGSGERFTYMANKSAIHANLAMVLQNKVSFIRVLRLPTTPVRKKGSGGTNNDEVIALNVSWFYDWGFRDTSTPTREFVPMSWGSTGASDANINSVIQKDSVTHYLAFNEPDADEQANIYVINALPLYKKLLRAGKRMGSPACTESQYRTWLDSFSKEAYKQNMTFDYVCLHWYDWGNYLSTLNTNPNPVDVFNRFKSHIEAAYDFYKKPIWITEFNANINRLPLVHQEFMKLALPWLDSYPNVERYAYFFGNDIPARNNGVLSAAGKIYSDHTSVNAYTENIYDTRPAFPISLAGWNSSAITQGGLNVSTFAATLLNTNMTSPLPITRGSGVDLPFTTSSDGYWGGTDWSTTTAADGINANKFLRFSLRSRNNKSVNYHSIDKLNIRISAAGPIKYQIDYQLNSGAFYPIATLAGPTRVTGNYLLGPIDLSQITGLQDVPASSTITFRITPFDATGAGSFLIGSGTADTDSDLLITGGFSDSNLIAISSLPVTLNKFTSKKVNNKVVLQWNTSSEINFSHFVLERSEDANSFTAIAKINKGEKQNGNSYIFEDAPFIASNKYYYRLKMIDDDGTFKYSKIIVEYFGNKDELNVFPSPVSGNTITVAYNGFTSKTELKIYELNGKLVKVQVVQNSTNEKVNISQLKPGTYVLLVQNVNKIQTKKFVKL